MRKPYNDGYMCFSVAIHSFVWRTFSNEKKKTNIAYYASYFKYDVVPVSRIRHNNDVPAAEAAAAFTLLTVRGT